MLNDLRMAYGDETCSSASLRHEVKTNANIDRNIEKGMGITAGRLREDHLYDYKFIGLSHNTVRGAAGGAVLIAELLAKQGYITHKD